MTINVEQSSPTYKMVDGWFKCQHKDMSIDENGVYCPGCENRDLAWGEAQDMFNAWEDQQNLGFDESDCNE